MPVSRTVILACDYSLTYVGGAQVAFIRQARALASQGWRVIAAAPHAAEAFRHETNDNLIAIDAHIRFTLPGLSLPVLKPRKILRARMREVAQQYDARAIIVHSEFALAGAALEVATELNIPMLQTVHTFFWQAPRVLGFAKPFITMYHCGITGLTAQPSYSGSTAINNALRSMTLRVATRADVVLSPSAHQAEDLRSAGAKRAVAFSNVVQSGSPAEPLAADAPLTLAWVGRFAPEKRLQVVLEAMQLVEERLGAGRVHLHVAGGRGKQMSGVTFHGQIPSRQVSELLAGSDAAVISSLGFDNQPMVALEAFTLGRPVIVTDPVLATEFAPAAVGTSTPDAAGLADTIIALATDRARVRELGTYAAEYARQRQAPEHAARLAALIVQAELPHTRR